MIVENIVLCPEQSHQRGGAGHACIVEGNITAGAEGVCKIPVGTGCVAGIRSASFGDGAADISQLHLFPALRLGNLLPDPAGVAHLIDGIPIEFQHLRRSGFLVIVPLVVRNLRFRKSLYGAQQVFLQQHQIAHLKAPVLIHIRRLAGTGFRKSAGCHAPPGKEHIHSVNGTVPVDIPPDHGSCCACAGNHRAFRSGCCLVHIKAVQAVGSFNVQLHSSCPLRQLKAGIGKLDPVPLGHHRLRNGGISCFPFRILILNLHIKGIRLAAVGILHIGRKAVGASGCEDVSQGQGCPIPCGGSAGHIQCTATCIGALCRMLHFGCTSAAPAVRAGFKGAVKEKVVRICCKCHLPRHASDGTQEHGCGTYGTDLFV